jgi:hypothetical protein
MLSWKDKFKMRFFNTWEPFNAYPMLPDDGETFSTTYKGIVYYINKSGCTINPVTLFEFNLERKWGHRITVDEFGFIIFCLGSNKNVKTL